MDGWVRSLLLVAFLLVKLAYLVPETKDFIHQLLVDFLTSLFFPRRRRLLFIIKLAHHRIDQIDGCPVLAGRFFPHMSDQSLQQLALLIVIILRSMSIGVVNFESLKLGQQYFVASILGPQFFFKPADRNFELIFDVRSVPWSLKTLNLISEVFLRDFCLHPNSPHV